MWNPLASCSSRGRRSSPSSWVLRVFAILSCSMTALLQMDSSPALDPENTGHRIPPVINCRSRSMVLGASTRARPYRPASWAVMRGGSSIRAPPPGLAGGVLTPERAVPSRVPSGWGCHEGRGFDPWSPPHVGGGVFAPERAVPSRVPLGWGCHEGRGFGPWSPKVGGGVLAPERAVPSRVPSGWGCHERRGFDPWSPQVGGGVLAPERAVPFRVPSGWSGDPTEEMGGSSENVNGFAEVGTFSFHPEVLGCVGASIPFGCPRSVPLALWDVFAAPLAAGLAPPAAGTAPRVMRPSPSVTSVGAQRGPCTSVPFVVFTRHTPLDSCVVLSGVFTCERLRLRGCSHEGSWVRLPRWWFRPLLPSSVPLRDLLLRACLPRRSSPRGRLDSAELLRACLRRRSCPLGRLDSVELLRASLRCRSCPLGRLYSVELLRASLRCRSCPLGRLYSVELLRTFLRRRFFPRGRLDPVELLRAFLRRRFFPRGRLDEVERVGEGLLDLDRASRAVVVGDRPSWLLSASLAPWCVARVDGMLPGFSGQAGMSPAQ